MPKGVTSYARYYSGCWPLGHESHDHMLDHMIQNDVHIFGRSEDVTRHLMPRGRKAFMGDFMHFMAWRQNIVEYQNCALLQLYPRCELMGSLSFILDSVTLGH